ncbi:MAG: hypothetical protein ACOC2L_02155, partial [Candidatus Sumerlaeota bacterium]
MHADVPGAVQPRRSHASLPGHRPAYRTPGSVREPGPRGPGGGADVNDARLILDPAFTVAPVRRRTFGSFVGHLGRAVYTGIHEPGHPTADADGFRGDVLDLVR